MCEIHNSLCKKHWDRVNEFDLFVECFSVLNWKSINAKWKYIIIIDLWESQRISNSDWHLNACRSTLSSSSCVHSTNWPKFYPWIYRKLFMRNCVCYLIRIERVPWGDKWCVVWASTTPLLARLRGCTCLFHDYELAHLIALIYW